MDYLNSPDFAPRVEELMRKRCVPGLAVAVIEGERTFSAGYGLASVDPPRPCTADTIFDIASSSKSLTAASVGLLVRDDDKYPDVKYESTVSSLLPEDFVMSDPDYTKRVTVEDILSHRSGLPRHDDSYLGIRAARVDDARSVTRNLRNLPVSAPIRSKYMYNNIMYTVATYLVEKKSGQTFADFLQERIFGPLGMSSSHLQPERARSFGLGDRIAMGHEWDKKTESYTSFEALESPEAQGAGSIMTTVNDYVKWVKALMNQEHPIDEEVYKGLVRNRMIVSPDVEDPEPLTSPLIYTAGMEIFYYRGYAVIGHDGGVPGFGSRYFFVPDFKFGGALFGNSGGAGDVATILSRELIDAVLGVPASERPKWEEIHAESDVEYEQSPKQTELRRVLREETQPQKMPLSAYTGEYWSPGYHGMIVTIKDDKLFVDATDRSMGYTLVFEHVRDQTEYITHLSEFFAGSDDLIPARFMFHNDRAVKLGLELETQLDDFIWFDRVEEGGSTKTNSPDSSV
ncbi:putative beta-lactamase family protein [Rosellinia necatrix]|uniref:Putative beta-lactamase family protein n=1 Tax=Rosellinia necatrix TaxID=77044 RepID=A0A1W2TUQ7_ROSNE|nr:putative beta-lactamase family protein [Rosellinia necatrix]